MKSELHVIVLGLARRDSKINLHVTLFGLPDCILTDRVGGNTPGVGDPSLIPLGWVRELLHEEVAEHWLELVAHLHEHVILIQLLSTGHRRGMCFLWVYKQLATITFYYNYTIIMLTSEECVTEYDLQIV